ncbi:cell division protein [Legionella steigerwaltii]|uniref:Cell division protein ZipA n=1 Tax=Legionella steigerwaltii TaxID=460 RepID=A0A378L5L1_9GAMM|nr:cell division protein ZipA C-terminal FtsZ-binding domain-containing protein [Legionella steigerwaltii]KTD77271.1 cell division protein [Legionella steigerwaltii]STY21997.1 cell division protein [Legionella steigerwaltii]
MQANWSLILNVLLLVGVIVAIGRLMKARRQSLNPERYQPNLGTPEKSSDNTQNYNDDIIAVRKINTTDFHDEMEADEDVQLFKNSTTKTSQPRLMPLDDEEQIKLKIEIEPKPAPKMEVESSIKTDASTTLMMFLLAKENRQFAGYELLQTVLAAGLRFGEGSLFHRHQFPNGQGPVLCSLAAATATGVFDLQNIGAFSVRGLCLYMHSSKNPGIDIERFAVMLETARQLSEGLDAHLLDDQRKPLTEERIARYHRLLQINQSHFEFAAV